MPQKEIKHFKHNENGLIIDCVFPVKKARRVIILLDGLPNPGSRPLETEWLAQRGYAVLYPKYLGTWESTGKFLVASPANEIRHIVRKLSNSSFPFASLLSKRRPIIIASSFGSSVALNLKEVTYIKRIYCLSPVINYLKVNGIETLETYLRTYYPMGFRFSHRQWQKLIHNKLMKPNDALIRKTAAKWLFFAGADDAQIPFEYISEFAKLHGCSCKVLPFEHISLYAIMDPRLRKHLHLA
jgi:hypothetical protein